MGRRRRNGTCGSFGGLSQNGASGVCAGGEAAKGSQKGPAKRTFWEEEEPPETAKVCEVSKPSKEASSDEVMFEK